MRDPVRKADIFHAGMVWFLFGTFAAARGWDIFAIFLILAAAISLALIILQPSLTASLATASALAIIPCSVFYFHLRSAEPIFNASSLSLPLITDSLAARPSLPVSLPYSETALLQSFLKGSTYGLPSGLKKAMMASGTSYLVGMYGYKLHLLAEAVIATCSCIMTRSTSIVISLIIIAVFIGVVGMPASAIRAGIMIAFASVAELAGRRSDRSAALLLAAFLMTAWDPAAVGNPGFILSFASLAGIYALAPAITVFVRTHARFSRVASSRIGRLLAKIFAPHITVSIAVNLAILPLVAGMDGSFPLISLLSNTLAALPFGFILGWGAGFVIAGRFIPAAAILFIPPLHAVLAYEITVISGTARLPVVIPSLIFSPLITAAYFFALALFAFRFRTPAYRS